MFVTHLSTVIDPGRKVDNLYVNSNALLNKFYYPDSDPYSIKRPYIQHACYFMRTDILQMIGRRWKNEIDYTCTHRRRHENDTAMPFMQANVALEEFGAKKQNLPGLFGTWTTDVEKNDKFWDRIWSNHNICVCMNDALDNSPRGLREIDHLQQLFEEKLPEKSFIEK